MTIKRIDIIRQRLLDTFSPAFLEVVDDSMKHHGHAGFDVEGSHFSITIVANELCAATRIDAHRKIYSLFNDMIPAQIHALKINVRSNVPQKDRDA